MGVVGLLILVAVGLSRRTVPPGIGPASCLIPGPPDERPNDSFARRGGRSVRDVNIQWQVGKYTIADVAQGRKLERYDKLELTDPKPKAVVERWRDPLVAEARMFLWKHWQERKRGYLILTGSSVDHISSFHVFIEPDDLGRWRVYQRIIDRREVTDQPTIYSMRWVVPGDRDKPGILLTPGQQPDPVTNQLELRGVCGELDSFF